MRGQGMVEFALIAPTFFIFVFAIMEAAFVVNAQLTLDNATREGARVGSLCGGSITSWQDPNNPTHQWSVSGPLGSPCPGAMDATVRSDLGILSYTSTNPNIPPATAPAPGSDPTNCTAPSGFTGYYAPQGCLIEIDVSYSYSFFFNFLIGPGAPSITLTSKATAVSQ